MDIKLAKVYEPLLTSNKNFNILISGRNAGKTKNTALISCILSLKEKNSDGIVGRAIYGSIYQSIYSEFESILKEINPNLFKFKKNPLQIKNLLNGNNIYFMGLSGNEDRTKGFKPEHDVKFVVIEETQELKDRNQLDQALASFRRNFGNNVKVFILGNPPPFKAHRFNQYVEECKRDNAYLVLHTSYLDILEFLNDVDLREILKMKLLDEQRYNWLYLGEAVGSFGSIYPMFNKNMIINSAELLNIRNNLRPVALIIGGDGAVNNDATAFVPILLFENGQSVVLDIFYHNPKINQVVGSHILVKEYVSKWLNNLIINYNFGTLQDKINSPFGNANLLPIYFRIDNAATDLIKECQYYFGDRCEVLPIKKGSIVEMVSSVQSALSNDFIYFLDNGGYFNYFKNQFVKCDNVLTTQLEMLIWNEQQTGYENSIPNDVSDAFTYGVRFWYSNIENKVFFENLKKKRNSSISIKNIINH